MNRINKKIYLNIIVSALALYSSVGFSQTVHRNANYYFQQANIQSMVGPEHYNDTLIRRCIKLYSKAIQLKPNFSQAYRNRGRMYGDLKMYQNAIDDINQSIKYCKKNDKWYLRGMLGEYFYLTGQYLKSISEFNYARSFGNESYYYLMLAKSYWQLGQKEKACIEYKKAIKIEPDLVRNKEFLLCN